MSIEIGVTESVTKERELKKRRVITGGEGASGGRRNRGGGGGNNGGGDDGGNDNFDFRRFDSSEEQVFEPDKLRIVMWFLLLVVLMTFGGLISAYVVIATNGVAEWKPFELPVQVLVSTALILACSLTYALADRQLGRNNQQTAKKWLLATTALGATFVSSQILVWLWVASRGIYMRSNPYAGFFYILTVVHAAHVLGGIAALGYVVLRTWRETNAEAELIRRRAVVKTIGWYWHFMGALWIALFVLLAFWK